MKAEVGSAPDWKQAFLINCAQVVGRRDGRKGWGFKRETIILK